MSHICDLLVENTSRLVTCEPELFDSVDEGGRPIGLVDDGCVAVSEGRVVWIGPRRKFASAGLKPSRRIDARGMLALPGLVDCHTHTVFAGTREREYEARIKGATYMEIAASGGGIRATVEAVRRASTDDLVRLGRGRVRAMVKGGVTTVEIKSGYALTTDGEIRMLEAIRRIARETPAEIVPTFLGAHDFPPEFADDRQSYVDLVAEEMIPEVARRNLAEFCDVFCERGVFTARQSERILSAAKVHGLKPKVHADEFADSGGAAVAAEVGAVSAEHLLCASPQGLAAMREAGTVAVLLPGVSLGLARHDFADARGMLDMGLDVALGTDFNPGTSMVSSLITISSLACSYMHLAPDEAILAVTRAAAKALARDNVVGSLKVGKRADVVLLDVPDFRYIPYHVGADVVRAVIKGGAVVYESVAKEDV